MRSKTPAEPLSLAGGETAPGRRWKEPATAA